MSCTYLCGSISRQVTFLVAFIQELRITEMRLLLLSAFVLTSLCFRITEGVYVMCICYIPVAFVTG